MRPALISADPVVVRVAERTWQRAASRNSSKNSRGWTTNNQPCDCEITTEKFGLQSRPALTTTLHFVTPRKLHVQTQAGYENLTGLALLFIPVQHEYFTRKAHSTPEITSTTVKYPNVTKEHVRCTTTCENDRLPTYSKPSEQ